MLEDFFKKISEVAQHFAKSGSVHWKKENNNKKTKSRGTGQGEGFHFVANAACQIPFFSGTLPEAVGSNEKFVVFFDY